jgi:outer membrane protein assembly factor BamB
MNLGARGGAGLVLGIIGVLGVIALLVTVFDGLVLALHPNRLPATLAGPPGIAFSGSKQIERARLLGILGDPATSGLRDWPGFFDAAPKVVDINGDGIDEFVAQGNDTNVYVFSTTGRALAVLPTHIPKDWYLERVLNVVEAAVMRPGEPTSLIVTNHASYVSLWRFEPAKSDAKTFSFSKGWERRIDDPCRLDPSMDSKPTIVDLNGDGVNEILVQNEEEGLYALTADGGILWSQCWAGGNDEPIADDLNGDGKMEAIFTSDSGLVSVFDGATGAPEWSFNADDAKYGMDPGSISVSAVTAELDGRPPKEILFTARQAPAEGTVETYKTYHMGIFAIHQDAATGKGDALWFRQPQWAHPLSYTHLVVRDVDNDGRPDIFGMDWNTIGHYPGKWEPLGPSHVFRLDAAGNELWTREIDSWWSNKDVALGDADHDGQLDLLVDGTHEGSDGLFVLSAKSGNPRGFFPAAPFKLLRGAQFLDIRHDGSVQIAYPVMLDRPGTTRGGILVLELWRNA